MKSPKIHHSPSFPSFLFSPNSSRKSHRRNETNPKLAKLYVYFTTVVAFSKREPLEAKCNSVIPATRYGTAPPYCTTKQARSVTMISSAARSTCPAPTVGEQHTPESSQKIEHNDDRMLSRTRSIEEPTVGSTPAASTSGKIEDNDKLLFERRRQVLRSSWQAVRFGLDVRAVEIFYNKLFEDYPQVRDIFPSDMSKQYHKLYAAVGIVLQFLDRPDELLPVLRDLGIRHSKYGAKREYYEAVTETFLWTLNSYIFSKMPNNNALRWAFDVADAWEWAFSYIGRTMAEAAEEEIARIRDEEEARIAVEKAMRISGSFDEHEDNDDDVNDPLPSEYC
mmetsp:Transcript_20451/g.36905  ORF Transcript_20451/g.36905 Transcript_20451/m.36905 type:complete len:336 (+) Transcript_20451:84-1091(+)